MKLEKFSSFSLFIQFFTLFCATSVAPFPGLGRSPPWGHGRPTRENLGTCSVPKQAGQAGRQKLQAKLRNLWHVACLHALPRNSTIIWITLLYQLFQPPTQRIPYNFKIINFSKLKQSKIILLSNFYLSDLLLNWCLTELPKESVLDEAHIKCALY